MKKRILIAWELGSGQGHLLILGWIADALRRRGFEPVFALQRLDGTETIQAAIGDSECYQSPLWPGQIDRAAFYSPGSPTSFGDVLGGLGLRSPAAAEGVLRAWDDLIALIAPAAVVADFAPACLTAARGKVPTVAVGDGLTLPPATLEHFTKFAGDDVVSKFDETEMLSNVNRALRMLNRRELHFLPQLFAADRSRTSSFTELDPYRKDRTEPLAAPWVPAWDRTVPMSSNEIFAYLSIDTETRRTILLALAQVAKTGARVRVYIPQIAEDTSRWLKANGIVAESAAVPFGEIHRSAGLVVSLGSVGFVACALASGIPQVVMPLGMTKSITGMAIENLGVGRWADLNPASPIEPMLLSQVIIETYGNARFAEKAKNLAPDFARRLEPSPANVIADLVAEIA